MKELKTFARVSVEPHAKVRLRVRLPVDMLNFTDARGERIVEPGEFELMIGSSSRDIHLNATLNVTGVATRTLERDWRMVSEVQVI
ncbi:fibronectin type III-like domain-contianing protein [Paraburkholderia humisilvae]|uniref:fibronectin type III-like domain-contianing protein n=1 Tax=Paraburkholderia humisilvae TaxID=627669 RepID=UPI00361C343E